MKSSLFGTLLLTLIFMCLTPVCLFASGQNEQERIQKARELMDAREYKQALLLLTEIRRANPDLKELTQAYYDECFFHQESVTRIEREIVDAIDQLDLEKAYQKMEELRTLDKKELEAFFKDFYEREKFAKNRINFIKIMDDAYALVQQSKWKEAIETYKQGFGLYREEFRENTKYGNIIRPGIDALFLELEALLAEYYARSDAFAKGLATVSELAAEKRIPESLSRAETLSKESALILRLRRRIISVGKRLIQQNRNLKKINGNEIGDYYLVFSVQVILGRTDHPAREGLFYVVERHWEGLADAAVAWCRTNADLQFSLAQEASRRGNADQADAVYILAGRFASWGSGFLGQFVNTAALSAPRRLDKRDTALVTEKLPLYAYLVERGLEARQYRNLSDFGKRYAAISARAVNDEAAIRKSQEEVRLILEALTGHLGTLEGRNRYLNTLGSLGYAVTEAARSLPAIIAQFSGLIAKYRELDVGYMVKLIERDYQPLRDALADREKRFTQAKDLREGTGREKPAEAGRKYPGRALEAYKTLQSDVRLIESQTADLLAKWSKQDEAVKRNPKVADYLKKAGELEKNAKALREKLNDEIDAAAKQKARADELWEAGRSDFLVASADFKNKLYQKTLEGLAKAKTNITTSLSNEWDEARRKFLEGELENLRLAAVDEASKRSLEEFRKNLTQVENLYYVNDFEGAEEALDTAERLLKEISQEAAADDTEIKYWRDKLKKALALNYRANREVTIKDPQYAAISTRQNQAQKYFQAGIDSQAKGNRTEAEASFKQARDELEQIKKDRPYLKDSGVLYLKVLRAENDALYKRRINEVLEEAKRKPDVRALSDLEDLLEVDSNITGLREAIARVREVLYPPVRVSPEDLRNARAYYNRAVALRKTGTRQNLKEALDNVNLSLALNPLDGQSRELKNGILQELNRRK